MCNIIHKMHHPNKIKRAFCTIILCFVHGLCLGFVVWQTIKCTTKYLRKPQVTIVSLKDSVDLPFPALTICGTFGKDYDNHEMRFNATYLQNVCDLSHDDYVFFGHWAANRGNCTDPKELFESIVFKPQNVMKYFAFHYWHSKEHDKRVDGWYIHDTFEFGRCFTLEPSEKYIEKGIRKIVAVLLANGTIFTHTPGMFLKENDGGQTRQEKYFELGKDYKLHLTYEYHESLDVDYGGDSCENDLGAL